MLAEGHYQAAEDIEVGIEILQASRNPRAARAIIECSWGAAFHWIAFGCASKHGRHQDSHARLGRLLRDLGELSIADSWETLESVRQGGWYGGLSNPNAVQRALDHLEYIRLWAK